MLNLQFIGKFLAYFLVTSIWRTFPNTDATAAFMECSQDQTLWTYDGRNHLAIELFYTYLLLHMFEEEGLLMTNLQHF